MTRTQKEKQGTGEHRQSHKPPTASPYEGWLAAVEDFILARETAATFKMGNTTMAIYSVRTDGFSMDDFEAESLDAAIAEAFAGEIKGVKDEETLREKFKRFAEDGGYVRIEEDGIEVLAIGEE